jgi:hypothetical protein
MYQENGGSNSGKYRGKVGGQSRKCIGQDGHQHERRK